MHFTREHCFTCSVSLQLRNGQRVRQPLQRPWCRTRVLQGGPPRLGRDAGGQAVAGAGGNAHRLHQPPVEQLHQTHQWR